MPMNESNKASGGSPNTSDFELFDADGNQASIDSVSASLQTITYEHHEIHSGSHYFANNFVDLSINHVLQITIQTPDTTKWAHWTWSLQTKSETLWQLYETASITTPLSGALVPMNNNRNSENTSGLTMRYEDHASLAAANASVDVTGATLLETGETGSGNKSLGNDSRDNEIILEQNTIYVLRATAVAAGYVDFSINWYEHTNKA